MKAEQESSQSAELHECDVDEAFLCTLETEARRLVDSAVEAFRIIEHRSALLVSLLLAGAGGVGTLTLSQVQAGAQTAPLVALGATSLWWFYLAGWTVWHLLRTKEIPAAAPDPVVWLNHLPVLESYRTELIKEGGKPPTTSSIARQRLLRKASETAAKYRGLAAQRWKALEQVYQAAAFTPLVCLPPVVLAAWLS